MCLENTLLEKCSYKVCSSYWLWPIRLLDMGYYMGYYMKPVSDSHSSIWNRILADHEVQFVNRIELLIGW